MFTRLRRLVVMLAAADLAATLAALRLADLTRQRLPFGFPLGEFQTRLNSTVYLLAAVVCLLTFLSLRLYDVRRDSRLVGDAASLARAVAAAVFAFAGALYFSYRDVPRLLVVYFFVWELVLLALARLVILAWLAALRRRGQALSRVLLVGSGELAVLVAQAVRTRLGDAVELVGCAADEPPLDPAEMPVLGRVADVPRLVRELQVDEVILALPSEEYIAAEAAAFALLDQPVRVRLVPDYLRLVLVQSSVEALGGIPLIGLREPRISGLAWAVKRVFDLAAVTLLLLLTWPGMLVIALAIRLDSPGSIFFTQPRVGENGRLFRMHKFRTMISNADMLQPDVELDPRGRQVYKSPDDRRITRIGRFLRRSSLDELPQFFNVLKGEMSLVGPRPELPFIVEQYEPWQRQRLAVPPGITGWWQVNGRSTLPMHLNTHLDLYYIRNYSLWLDIVILFRTASAVLRGRGAF